MIETRDLSVTFGDKLIVSQVCFEARPGHVTAIVGPNGCGKTTLLRALTGEVPHSGMAMLDGVPMAEMSSPVMAARRAVLAQATPLAFPFNVFEVVRLGLQTGVEGGLDDLPSLALEKVGLAGFESRYYQELSGGEKQRVQLARVLVQVWRPVRDGKANWLFLDEPVSALDIGHQIEVMALAKEFAQRGGGVIAVMHDLNLTALYADSIALFEKGALLIQDAPEQVLTDENLSRAYRWPLRVRVAPQAKPFVLPHAAGMN